MLTRRLLLATPFAFAAGCSRPKGVSSPRRSTHDGVDFIEVFARGADEASPIIVAIHGRGDKPENWIDFFEDFSHPARIVLPRAFMPFGDGWSWFALRDGMTDDDLGTEVGNAEARLWQGVAKLTAGRKVLVTGFSQGGILSFAIASRHADVVAYAFPMAGSCPGPLLPKPGKPPAPLVAFHGIDDNVLQFRWGRAAVTNFRDRGGSAELREYPGVGHQISAQMRADLFHELAQKLPLVS